mgnify:FL=1
MRKATVVEIREIALALAQAHGQELKASDLSELPIVAIEDFKVEGQEPTILFIVIHTHRMGVVDVLQESKDGGICIVKCFDAEVD